MTKPVIAWIHANSTADWWGYAHDRGRLAIEERFGREADTALVDRVGAGEGWLSAAHDLAETASVVFVCDVAVTDLLAQVAAQHPDTRFVHCQGAEPSVNVATFHAARDEHAFVSGMLAGAASRSGVLGLVEGVRSPHDLLYTNAWVLGARRGRPDVRVRVRWLGSYHGPDQSDKERRAVLELAASGADVIGGNLAENPAVVEAAGEAGLFASAHDERLSGLPHVLDASYLDWRPYYLRTIESVLDGTWRPRARRLRAADGVVRNTDPAAWLPASAIRDARGVRAALERGSFPIWKGPIRDERGRIVVEAGDVPGDSDRMRWLVDGITE